MKSKIIHIDRDEIKFDNGFSLTSDHSQDCCEHHWLDFSYVKPEDVEGLEFDLTNENFFNRIDGYGIELIPVNGFSVKIPGYGSNNGYYGTNIELIVWKDGSKLAGYDVSDCQEISG